ncbi:acetyltransferase [Clostridia bacterium]|nr:acetyltransferase [Clostridia bacterium]
MLHTERLLLRPWRESDAESLYRYASDPAVGPAAGWHVHTDVENSRQIIRDFLSAEETYAIMLIGEGAPNGDGVLIEERVPIGEGAPNDDAVRKRNTGPIGSIGLMVGEKSNLVIGGDEGEIGYWIGVPYWGQGLVPEAVRELLRHGFEDLGLKVIWCGYFDGNEKSRRAQEKCGFRYHHTEKDKPWPLMGDIRTEHVTRLTKEEWLAEERGGG